MQVSDVMTRAVECTRPEATLREVAKRMSELEVGPMPVCDHDRLVGMITDRDITVRAIAEGADPDTTPVRDVMTQGLYYCFDDQEVADAAQEMKDKQVRRLAVLDRNKRLVGIVSLGDMAIVTHDDELVGETLEAVSESKR
jgi:CBS domain-containing protein